MFDILHVRMEVLHMLYKKVLEKALYVSEWNLADFLFENGIEVKVLNTLNEEACLLLSNSQAVILIRDDLNESRVRYAIIHEIGHYVLDIEDGKYSFIVEFNRSRSEFKANLFACFCLLKNVDLSNLNVIQYLINNGCPQNIAIKVFDYIKQNMSKEDMMRFCEI